jgi:hypothetical protein
MMERKVIPAPGNEDAGVRTTDGVKLCWKGDRKKE